MSMKERYGDASYNFNNVHDEVLVQLPLYVPASTMIVFEPLATKCFFLISAFQQKQQPGFHNNGRT